MSIQTTEKRVEESQVRGSVDALLAERQRLLVAFCKLAGVEPFSDKRAVACLLQEFCQRLMDYSALGHFELLARFAGEDASSAKLEVLAESYPSLAENTELAVRFNDQYDPSDHVLNLDHLERDLSAIGEALAARFELEDRVIGTIVLT